MAKSSQSVSPHYRWPVPCPTVEGGVPVDTVCGPVLAINSAARPMIAAKAIASVMVPVTASVL
jgi:hypothetical protein